MRAVISNGFAAPVMLALGAAGTIVVTALFAFSASMNASAFDNQAALLKNGVNGRVQELNRLVTNEVVWDQAVENLANHYSSKWARDNVGSFMIETNGFDSAFVLDANDKPLYARMTSKGRRFSSDRSLVQTVEPLLKGVRAAEAVRRLDPTPNWRALMKSPIQASTFGRIDGRTGLVSATLVQPDFGLVQLKTVRAPVIVTVRAIEPEVAILKERFLLRQLHFSPAPPAAGEAGMALTGLNGETLGHLVWRPDTPGDLLVRHTLPPLALLLLLMFGGCWWFYRRASRATESLIASEARSTHMALHDALTGLPNRRLFADRLSHALDQSRRDGVSVAVLSLDLDRFKEVNDGHGHHVGDELISAIAKRLLACCRSSDTFARLGGDEFAVVQHGGAGEGGAALAERFLQAFKAPLELSCGAIYISGSIGISVSAGADTSGVELLRQSDLALYRAKESGRNKYAFFETEMDVTLKKRRGLEADLRQALSEGALVMHYQPQIDGYGAVTGVEALVRWTHPERGPISPVIFIPLAEESGLIQQLGMFTLRRAFEDSARWPRLKVAINVSARQLSMPSFATDLRALVAEMGVNPTRFELEITEGILLGDNFAIQTMLRDLKDMGFSLALDDFGTGYSSLSYLRKYPIDKIKIDRSFISNLGVDAEADEVVSAIVKLAQALKLSIIAEGVETNDQRQRLADIGCGEIQGFLFSKPLPADEVEGLTRVSALAHRQTGSHVGGECARRPPR